MSLSSTEQILKLSQLQEELQAVVAQIISDVDRSMAASEIPVELSRSKILDDVRHAIVSDKYLVVSNDTETAKAQVEALRAKAMVQLGDFARLPREVRDIIFSLLIESGSIGFLQASRQLAREGTAHIFENGICRMNFGFNNLTPTMRPSHEVAARIQRISIRVNTVFYPLYGAPDELEIPQLFTGAEISRKSCRVTFENWLSSSPMVCDEILFILQRFTGFEDVIVHVKVEGWHSRLEKVDEYDLALVENVRRRAYRKVIRALEESLGSPYHGLHDEDDMVFHPRRERVESESEERDSEEDQGVHSDDEDEA